MKDREKLVRELKDTHPDESNAQIGARCGLSKVQVWRALNPESYRKGMRATNAQRASAKRIWANEHDRPLCECGNRMGVGAHRKGHARCLDCWTEEKNARRDLMIWLRRQGLSNIEISVELNLPYCVISGTLSRARKADSSIPMAPYMQPGGRSKVAA